MADTLKIYESFFEDNNGNKHFFYNSKKSIIGLSYPDNCIKNDNCQYKYIRIGYIQGNPENNSNEDICVNETILLQLEAGDYDMFEFDRMAKINIRGILKGSNNAIPKVTFTCTCETPFLDMTVPKIYLGFQSTIVDGLETGLISIWVSTEHAKKIFTTLCNSHANNKLPVDVSSFNNKYTVHMTNFDNIVIDDDTCNTDSFIESIKICTGVNILQPILDKISNLEAKQFCDMRYTEISYDSAFEPLTEGDESDTYQIITPSTLLGNGLDSPFLLTNTSAKYVQVQEKGTYSIQLVSGIFSNDPDNSDTGKIEVIPYINSDNIESLHLIYDPKLNMNQISTSSYVVKLSQGDIIRLRFRFIGNKGTDIRNNGYTFIKVTKLV